MTAIYRFKLSNDITEMVTSFAKIHQFDDRKTYKESWLDWCNENNEELNREVRRLTDLGYEGDVLDKMYKAGRYYFRTKNLKEKKEPKKRRAYISMNSEMLEAMDEHIKQNANNDDYSPASGFDNFCETNKNLLAEEVTRICTDVENVTAKMLSKKIKKTYKNRYYLYSKQN